MADVETTAQLAAKKTEKFAEKVTATATETVQQTAEAATNGFKTMQAEVTGGLKQAAELARGYVDVQRTALETVVKAGQIYGEGLQSLASRAADANRTQFEHTVAHLKALTSVKSVKEAISLQTSFARDTASRVLSETSSFAEDYLKVAGQALAPVTARVREAAEKVKHVA
jgi:phasin family protein